MAVLAIAAGGALVGSAIGGALGAAALGAQIGWLAGSFIGQMLFAPHTTVEGPRLKDLGVQSSTDGAPISEIYGTHRIAGNVIWSTDIIETKHEEEVGGKGGPSATQTTYTYKVSLAIALCDCEEGPITGIRRIWADSKLVHSIALGAGPSTFAGNLRGVPGIIARGLADQLIKGYMRIYYGTETQTADSLIVSLEGEANTPAFRGTAYVVLEEFQLADFANHIPNFEFEVVRSGDYSYPFFNPALSGIELATADLDTFRNRMVYAQHNMSAGEDLYTWDMTNSTPEVFATLEDDMVDVKILYDSYKDEVVLIEQVSGGESTVHFMRFDAATGALLMDITLNTNDYGPYVNTAGNTEVGGVVNCASWVYDEVRNCFYGYGTGFSSGDIFLVTLYTQTQAVVVQVIAAAGITAWNIHPSIIDTDENVWACGDDYLWKLNTPPEYFAIPQLASSYSVFYWPARGEIWTYASAAGVGWMIFNIDTETWAYANDSGYQDATSDYSKGVTNSQGQAWFFKVSGSAVDLDAILVNSDLTIEKTLTDFVGAPDGLARYFYATIGVIIPTPFNGTAQCFYENALEPGTMALSEVVEEICGKVDLTDTNVTDLASDVVRGYIRARPMTARQALEPLAMAYGFDGIESSATVKFVKRGGASVASLETSEMAARSGGVEDEAADIWVSTRSLETELPVVLTIGYSNQTTDYLPATVQQRRLTGQAKQEVFVELPIVFTSEEAAQVNDNLMRQAWIERETFKFSLGPEWHKLDPTDIVTLPDESRIRLTRTHLEPTGVLRCEAASDDEGALTSYAVGTVDEPGETITLDIGGATTLAVLDIPLLLDSHDDEGIYLGAAGTNSNWSGAVVYNSRDGGVTWSGLTPLRSSAKIGRIISGFMRSDVTAGIWDNHSVITVKFVDPDVAPEAPVSLDAFYTGANAVAIGDEDEWEIAQFYTPTDNGDGTFQIQDFLRGRRGTEWAIKAHRSGAWFVILESPQIGRGLIPVAAVGTEILFKGVTIGGSLSGARTDTESFDGVSMKPYSPVQIGSAKQSSTGNINLFWTRRARKTAEWINGIDVPLDETTEEYDLEFWTEGYGSLLRTVSGLTDTEYTYTAAMQSSDYGSPGDVDYTAVRIYQLSDRVGRGYPGEALVGRVPAPLTFDPVNTTSGFTLSEFNLLATRTGSAVSLAPGSRGFATGKWYWEILITGTVTNDIMLGLTNSAGTDRALWRGNSTIVVANAIDNAETDPDTLSGTSNRMMFAWDADEGSLWFGKNGSWGGGIDPSLGLHPHISHTPGITWRPSVRSDNSGSSYSVRPTWQKGNIYPIPDGFTLIG